MCKRLIMLFLVCNFVAGAMHTAADLQDPTRPDTAVISPIGTPAVAHFAVSAIFVSDHRRVAIINGKAVTAGDRIGGATVRVIDAHTVELSYQNKIIHTRLDLTKVRE